MIRKFPTLILLLTLAACDKVERADQAQNTTEPQPGLTPAPTPTPTPAPVAPTPPPAPRLAPEGVYYVVQRVDIMTDSGVIGLKPGTKVKLVRKSDEGMVITDGSREFTAQPAALTNDLDVVARIAQAEAAARAAASTAPPAPSPSSVTNIELAAAQAAATELQSRRQVLQAEETRILKQIEAANNAQNRYAIAKAKGTPIQQDPLIGQLPTLRARLDKVRLDISTLK